MAAISAKNVWAVGWFEDNTKTGIFPLIERFDGNNWSISPNIPDNSTITFLQGIAARSATDFWAEGVAPLGALFTCIPGGMNGLRLTILIRMLGVMLAGTKLLFSPVLKV